MRAVTFTDGTGAPVSSTSRTANAQGPIVTFRRPGARAYLQIPQTTKPAADALVNWQEQERAASPSFPGYRRLRYCRSAVVTAWSDMAAPPASIAGYPGSTLVLEALRDWTTTAAALDQLRADLGSRLVHRIVRPSVERPVNRREDDE